MLKTTIQIEDEYINIEISNHAVERMEQANLTQYEVFSLVMKMGEKILDLKDGEEFAIIDKELQNAIVCSINSRDTQLVLDVITVISNERVWISRGTKIYKIDTVDL